MLTFEQFQTNVQQWSEARGIYAHSTALAQALKAVSEVGELRKRTAFLLVEHKRVFNQNPSKRALMDHIKALQGRVDALETEVVKGGVC